MKSEASAGTGPDSRLWTRFVLQLASHSPFISYHAPGIVKSSHRHLLSPILCYRLGLETGKDRGPFNRDDPSYLLLICNRVRRDSSR